MSSFGLVPLPAISRLTSRVWRILGLNPGPYTLQGTNTYLVGTGASRLLIDTGAGVRGYVDNVVECMKQSGCERLEAVLVTHWHHDHTGGLADLLTHFAAPSAAPSRTASPVSPVSASSLGSTASTEDSSAASSLPSASATATEPLAPIPVYKHQPHLRGAAPTSLAFQPLTPTSRFAVEGATLTCVATPGHTADHVSFLLDEEAALFIGDTVLGHGTTVFRHLYDYTHTLHAVSRLAPLTLYPGHGACISDVQAKLAEYLQHRRMREQQLLRIVKQLGGERRGAGATALELVGKVYPPLSDAVLPAAVQNVTLHLEKLALEGEIASDEMEAERRQGGGKSEAGGRAKGSAWDDGEADGESEGWNKDYGELYESTSAMVARKSQWTWRAAPNGQGGASL